MRFSNLPFSWNKISQNASEEVIEIHLAPVRSHILRCVDARVCRTSRLLMDVVFPPLPLQTPPRWALCLCLFMSLLLRLWDRFLEVGLLNQKVHANTILLGTAPCFPFMGFWFLSVSLERFLPDFFFHYVFYWKALYILELPGKQMFPMLWLSPQLGRTVYFYGIHILKTLEQLPHWSSLLDNGMIGHLVIFPKNVHRNRD